MKYIMLKRVVAADNLGIMRRLILYERRWNVTHVYAEGSTKLTLLSRRKDVRLLITTRNYLPSPALQSTMDGT